MPDDDNNIKVTWDDLTSRKVESRLKEQDALSRTREYAKMDADSLPEVAPAVTPLHVRLWRNSVFAMALFGLIGGILAWACGASLQFRPDAAADAERLIQGIDRYRVLEKEGAMSSAAVGEARRNLEQEGMSNEYFLVRTDKTIPLAQREEKVAELVRRDKMRTFIANILAYGASGVLIAVFLAIAMPVTESNVPGAIINGSVGAALGLLGGVAVSLLIDPLQKFIVGSPGPDGHVDQTRQFLARVAVWGMMGLFLTVAPGIVMRNLRKFAIGLVGGLIGGLIGGVLYDPVVSLTSQERLATLAAMAAIGLFAGLATGLIENAAKSGWVKVVQGLIAGKQFILYRNPTFVGSGPDCQIYLFKDPRVGRRHAAFHIVPGGFELENLPLGSDTMVNGRPVARARLKNGDRVQIGSTLLVFQEKTQAA